MRFLAARSWPSPTTPRKFWRRRATAIVVGAMGALVSATLGPAAATAAAQSRESPASPRARPVVVASKPFGESYLLAEMFAQLLESRGIAVERRPGLGATEIAFGALGAGAIDVYPEYTGTGLLVVLGDSLTDSLRADRGRVFAHVARETSARHGMRWLPPLGFENTYAIAVRRETAERLGLRTLGDLARVSGTLTAGFTADFIGRADGLPGLTRAYGLSFADVRPLAPAVKYEALATGAVDVVDGYSTDGRLARDDLATLADDRLFFPPYEAAALVGARLARDDPAAVATLALLSGRLDVARMRELNRRIELGREDVAVVAADALRAVALVDPDPAAGARARAAAGRPDTAGTGARAIPAYLWSRRQSLASQAARHLLLVSVALGAAVLVGVPLGLGLERVRRAAEPVIGALGVLQTVPSIALLAFMIPLLGVGVLPALVALWAYALYPIARGTYSGVRSVDAGAVEAAAALGMTPAQRLLQVRLPLAAPAIMAGVRTAAVITVGAATLAAFIGAGGLGEPIVAGLALADTRMILSGALPAAVLALVVDGALALVERLVAPAHRRRRGPGEGSLAP